jgi:hypothetical protein
MENVKEKTLKNETYLPLFSGFYNTIWELDLYYIDEEIKNQREEKGLYSDYNVDDVKIDYESFENDVVENFAEALKRELDDFIINIEVQKIIHPKAYNFKNDSVDIKIEYKADEIKSYIYLNKEKFCEFLKARYTSRDGFFSHYSNEFETWESETLHFSDFSKNGHFLGSILDFICDNKNITESDLYSYTMDNICTLNYAENLDDVINKNDGSLFEFFTSHNITKENADYIVTSYNNGVIRQLCLSEEILSLIREFENQAVEV